MPETYDIGKIEDIFKKEIDGLNAIFISENRLKPKI